MLSDGIEGFDTVSRLSAAHFERCGISTVDFTLDRPSYDYCGGSEFGLDYVVIESSLSTDEFEVAVGKLIIEKISRLTVNCVEFDSPNLASTVAKYIPKGT